MKVFSGFRTCLISNLKWRWDETPYPGYYCCHADPNSPDVSNPVKLPYQSYSELSLSEPTGALVLIDEVVNNLVGAEDSCNTEKSFKVVGNELRQGRRNPN